MSTINDGGPAFPVIGNEGEPSPGDGMTLRQYAAIKLKVPNSGTDWLDAMIVESLLDDFAGQVLASVFGSQARNYPGLIDVAWAAYMAADAMLTVRKEGAA